jgi:hypothetical protein
MAKPTRRSRDYSEAEVAALMSPETPLLELLQKPPSESFGSITIEVPTWPIAGWVKGCLSEQLIRQVGAGDKGPVPQLPRRLTVVARDELDESKLDTKVFEFDPQHGGQVAVWGAGRGPDARGEGEGCQGKFSPFSTVSMRLELSDGVGQLVVVEQLATEQVERTIVVDELSPPSLYVEVVRPDDREPWTMRVVTESFRLDRVTSLELADVETSVMTEVS